MPDGRQEQLLLLRGELKQLDAEKSALEMKLTEALEYLRQTPAGLDQPLLDADGFPRDDCDLYAVRQARNTVDCTRNDLTAMNARIFELLNELHADTRAEAQAQMALDAAARRQRSSEVAKRTAKMMELQRVRQLTPFLTVTAVQPNSPAGEAGLCPGMVVLQYGCVLDSTVATQGLGAMATETSEREGQPLVVWVRADITNGEDDPMELIVVPQKWSGAGLLGCTFEPIVS